LPTYDVTSQGWREIEPLHVTTYANLLRRQKAGERLIGRMYPSALKRAGRFFRELRL